MSPTPHNHAVRGLVVGVGLLIVGFEFEYANLSEDTLEQLPGMKTYAGNVMVQTTDAAVQLYATIGAQAIANFSAPSRKPTSAPTSAAARRSI
jgi:hypothetical protein